MTDVQSSVKDRWSNIAKHGMFLTGLDFYRLGFEPACMKLFEKADLF